MLAEILQTFNILKEIQLTAGIELVERMLSSRGMSLSKNSRTFRMPERFDSGHHVFRNSKLEAGRPFFESGCVIKAANERELMDYLS